ncbi:MAG TPA: tetratricopeptide repeat protein [Burkholderiales bacterium]|nr:tetratricopeptide repeat protein [Burkholderiales bacterium]
MSVINQLLIDLDRRRASGAERSNLPNHVRALPQAERPTPWGWIAAGGAGVAVVLAMAWALISGFDWTQQRAAAAPPVGTEIVIEKVVAASAGVTADARPGDDSEGVRKEALASRLSFDLSSPPASAAREGADTPPPLSTARVIGQAGSDASASSEPSPVPAGRPAAARTPAVASARVAAGAPSAKAEIQKEVRQPSSRDLAENEYRKATALLHQGRLAESEEGFRATLNLLPGHLGARQALVGLLLDARKYGDAERVLQEGLALAPAQTGFAMTLARLQVDRGETAQGIATLRKGLEHAQGGADYLAFLAALLQRQGRHEEAIEQFQAALRTRPAAGVWWLGLGISLQSVNRTADAQEAYRRARASNNLSPELAAFAEQRLRQLQ